MKHFGKILLLLLFVSLLSGCSYGKYEGMSAEEWADEYYDTHDQYQKLKDCVEEYDINNYSRGVSTYCL